MKKFFSVLLLVVAMAWVMVLCDHSLTEPTKTAPNADSVTESAAPLETETSSKPAKVDFNFTHKVHPSTYHKPGFGEEYGVFRFEGTDVVVFNINTDTGGGWYLIGEDIGEIEGNSWGNIPSYETHFLALSDKYMLFLTENGMVAKDLEEREEEREDGTYLVHDAIPFDELPVEEQEAFRWPCAYETFSNAE